MADTFFVKVYSPEGTVFNGEAVSLTVPGAAGSLCLLARHESVAILLAAGTLVIRTPGETVPRVVRLTGNNFLEFRNGGAVVLLEQYLAGQ